MAQQVTALKSDMKRDMVRATNKPHVQEQAQAVILVESHLLMRLALQHVIATFAHFRITAGLNTIQDVSGFIDTTERQTVVLGPSISICDCLKLMKQVRERQAHWKVVVIQQDFHPETVHTLIEYGVHALLDESASEQDLEQAIRSALLGNIYLSRHVRGMLSVSMPGTGSHLTEREIQVLSRLKYGESNFRIARVLGLKEKTVEKYLTIIYDKLQVRSRAEAILCLQKLHF